VSTRRQRRRDRLEAAVGVMLITAALAFGALFLLSRTTDVFEAVPTATPTVVVTPTVNPETRPLPLDELLFTPDVSYGDTLQVEIYTEPGTRCRIMATVFSLRYGNYENRVLTDSITDSSGICQASLPIDEDIAEGEQSLHITLRNGGRSNQANWPFTVSAAP